MTHRLSQNILVRGTKRASLRDAIVERLEEDGFVPVKGEKSGVRIVLRSKKDTVLVGLSPGFILAETANAWLDREWAEYLALMLATEAFAICVAEDGEGSHVIRFDETGEEVAQYAIVQDGTKEISEAALGAKKSVKLKNLSGETFGDALTKAFTLPKRWLHLWDTDLDEGDETIVFRKRSKPPVLKPKNETTGFEPAAAAYRGREYAVGHFAFGAETNLDSVASIMTELVRAFCPTEGLRVQVTRRLESQVYPSRFSRTATIKAEALARGGCVELTAGPFFDSPMAGLPIFWIANDPAVGGGDNADDTVPLHFGFALSRPGAEKPELALAHAMSTIAEVAAGIEGCLSAIVTAQSASINSTNTTLPYETMAGTAAKAKSGRWLRAHARAPGWRVLVPKAKMKALKRPPPDGVSLERCPSGVLVQLDAATPFALGDTSEIERWLLPAFG